MGKLTPHQRIMRAAKKGTGIRLSAEEVRLLSADDAIEACAANDDERMRNPEVYDAWMRYENAITSEDRATARQRLIELGELTGGEG